VLTLVAVMAWSALPAVATAGTSPKAPRHFGAMTQNLYLGANLTPIFGATDAQLIIEAAAIYDHMLQVDFPARAEAVAALVAEERPDVLGLQEVALWHRLQWDGAGWNVVETVDYLQLLLEALASAEAPYRAVAVNENFTNATFPLPITFDLSTAATLTMRDVILVRDDVRVSQLRVLGTASGNYASATLVPQPGDPNAVLPVLRGWSYADIKLRGKVYRFANTHLEAFSPFGCDAAGDPSLEFPFVRNQQAKELVDLLASSPYPVVLAGDLNARPDNPCDAMAIFAAAGFLDAWAVAMPGIPAFTSGQTDDLDNVPSLLDHQVDYVLYDTSAVLDVLAGSGEILGEELDDRTPSGLWPSDHAGLAVTMHIARP
jgi:endonuclease/exonuclease/phosphatase family metal-dependent hydrolase